MRTSAAHRGWPDLGSPGSRPRSFCTCQVLRPRRAVRTLRWCVRNVLPSALETASAPGDWLSGLNGWPMPSPADASPASLRMPTHGSGPMSPRPEAIDPRAPRPYLAEYNFHYNHRVFSRLARYPGVSDSSKRNARCAVGTRHGKAIRRNRGRGGPYATPSAPQPNERAAMILRIAPVSRLARAVSARQRIARLAPPTQFLPPIHAYS